MKNNKGFTLLELLVVVLIIGILAAIALPQYNKIILKANLHKGIPFVASLYQAQQSHYMVHGSFAKNLTDLDITLPDGCTEELRRTEYLYICDFGTFYSSGFNSIYFLVPKQTIAYVQYLQDTTVSSVGVTFRTGKRYCFARPNSQVAQDVCENMGGSYLGQYSTVWKYYELK